MFAQCRTSLMAILSRIPAAENAMSSGKAKGAMRGTHLPSLGHSARGGYITE